VLSRILSQHFHGYFTGCYHGLLAKILCAARPRPRLRCRPRRPRRRGPAAGGGAAGCPGGPGGGGAAAPGSAGAASRQPRAAGWDAVRPPAKHCS